MSLQQDTLRTWLDGLRQRWRALTRLRVSARAAGAVALIAGGAWAIDRATSPTGLALVGLFAVAIAAAIGAVVWLRAPLRRPPTNRQLARLAEEQNGALDDVVVTATERLDAVEPGPLDGLLVRAAEARLPEVGPERVIAKDTMRRALRWTAASLVVLAIALAVSWAPAWRAVQTARLYIAPPRLAVAVTPGHVRVARGTPLRISARIEGLPEGATPDVPTLIVAAAGAVPQPMRRDGAGYVIDWPKVDADFRYRVVAGALTSPEYQVSAIDAARVTRIDLDYTFPAFTKLAPRHDEDGGDIFGPAGTTVRIRVHTDKPVRRGAVALENGTSLALATEGGDATTLSAGLTIAEDGAYRVGLEDIDGLKSPDGTQYFVRVLDDRPPDVRIMRPAGDRQVTKLEEVVIEARADDDHGVSSLELVYAVKGRGEKVVPFGRGARLPAPTVNGAHTLFIEELDVEPGDFVTYYARARDVSAGKLSTEARSDIFFLEVRPFSETFFAAQSQAGMGGGGAGAAADLLESQKEIIVATWKLQRRAIAGQSATDVRAIGKAQGDLRARAEALAAQAGRPQRPSRRRAEPGPPAPEPAGTTPLARAAGAMASAEASLNGLKPKDAVPHEMAAYNELLKLAAEETEKQVTRQRGGGGGGGGRTGTQDLSALFDEELMRQQQTNYENRSQAGGGAQGGDKKDDALERVKALARRQDELAEKQRELARARAAMPAEELKRQLERLTKEQEQLRREAEQLAQQMQRDGQQSAQNGQQNGQQQSGQQGGQQQGGQQAGGAQGGSQGGAQGSAAGRQQQAGSRELRQAASEMADAAKDLSRQDLDEARQRSARTLDRLRQLERTMGGESAPDDRRRQSGELELEARLLAEAQRRLADAARQAAGRAGAGGNPAASTAPSGRPAADGSNAAGAAADTARRLAQEQEGLAARADAFEKQLARVNKADAGEAAASAAVGARAELAKGKPGDDMRRAAAALRRGAAGTEGATREGADRAARAAETMARAAGQMAGGQGTDGRDTARLSDQLAALRQARQRAEAAEAALRDAVNRALAAAEAHKAAGTRDPAAEAQAKGEIGRLQGEFDRALGDARQLAQGAQSGPNGPAGTQPGGNQPGGNQPGRGLDSSRQTNAQAGGQNGGQGGRQGGEGARDGRQDGGYGAYGTPEGQEFSRSAPGTEAFKQDYARWDSLSKNVKNALEDLESSLADRLTNQRARDRVTAGEDDRAPAAYEEAVSRYYRSIARRPSP